MSNIILREQWEVPSLEAEMWHCGDEVCNCWEPQICLIEPNYRGGYPWIHRRLVWAGTFHSDPDSDEWQSMLAELRDAANRYRIPLLEREHYTPWGRRFVPEGFTVAVIDST